MAAWVKPTEQDYFRDIIEHGFDNNLAETFLRISRGEGADYTGDGNYYEVGSSDGVNYYDSVLVPIPPGDIGNWVFLAGTFDGTNWNLYRNGALAGSVAASTGDIGAIDVTNAWTSAPAARMRISSGRASFSAAQLTNRPFSQMRCRLRT